MTHSSTYYSCCNAKDDEVRSEAKFLATICPEFISLPKLFEVYWTQERLRGGLSIQKMRLEAIKRARETLEAINMMVWPNV